MSDIQTPELIEKLKDNFDEMVVFKDLKKSNFISSFKLPSFMRDWVLKRFQDEEGNIDIEGATDFIKTFIPKKEDWKSIKNRIVSYQEQVKFLAKISIDIHPESSVLDLVRRFFVSCSQISEALALRPPLKSGYNWQKTGRKSKCRKDSGSTSYIFEGFYYEQLSADRF